MPQSIYAPDVNAWLDSSIQNLVAIVGDFFTKEWPAVVVMVAGAVMVMSITRFGITGLRRVLRSDR